MPECPPGCEPRAAAGVRAYQGIKYIKHVSRDSFARAVLHHKDLPGLRRRRHDRVAQGVVGIEEAGMVQVLLDPALEELQVAEIHDKAVHVRLPAGEGKSY